MAHSKTKCFVIEFNNETGDSIVTIYNREDYKQALKDLVRLNKERYGSEFCHVLFMANSLEDIKSSNKHYFLGNWKVIDKT